MDDTQFDRLARVIAKGITRRGAMAGLLGGLLPPVAAAARAKDRHRTRKQRSTRQDKHNTRNRHTASQAEQCWRAGACSLSKGSNVSQCDLASYTAPEGLDCTRCNLSRANLRGADFTGVNFSRANLSGACLVNADFSGATFANNTNLANAIFCNTRMPDGSKNNSGCGSGSPCCGTCPAGQTYCQGECISTQTDPANCGTCGNACGGSNDCNTAVCNQGTCGTTPNTGAACNGGLGSCNDSGQCIATVCAGKTAANPCFERDASFCNAANTCNCGSDLNGNVACFENAFCNNGAQQCASNADCVNLLGFPAGSICFSATNCCIGATGCTTPCPT